MSEQANEVRTPVRLTDAEWNVIRSNAKAEVLTVIGERPTRKSVAEKRHDKPTINFVMWFGIVTLIALTVVTFFKAAFVTLPFATSFSTELLQGQNVPVWVVETFKWSSVVLSMLMSTPALIFFKLLSEEDRILKKIKETNRSGWFMKWFDLNWLTPRLPAYMVGGTMLWLFYTAAHGVSNIGDAFLRFLPVVMELALARLIGDILQQRLKFYDIISDVLKTEAERWDKEIQSIETDGRYLEALYRHFRTGLINVVRYEDELKRKGKHSPNAWLMQANANKVKAFINAEYERLTDGMSFRVDAEKLNRDRMAGQVRDGDEVVVPTAATHNVKRTPPNGDKLWTVNSMVRDFELRGLSKGSKYDRGQLDRDYTSGYGHRGAWANGAKDYFAAETVA